MKKVIFLVFLLPVQILGQVVDDFETDLSTLWTLSTPGRWNTDTLEALHGKRSLHHVFDNNASGNDCIGLSLSDLHPDEGTVKWSFLLRHGYDPSSSNTWFVYLMCDADPVSAATAIPANGYVAGVNLTGYDDTLRLWKIKDGKITTIISTGLNWQSKIGTRNPARISVERSASGTWNISVTDYLNIPVVNKSGTDKELPPGEWFIVSYKYTSTRDRLLWIDDVEINGVFYTDKTPPVISKIDVTARNRLEIMISEEPDDRNIIPANFYLNGNQVTATKVEKISGLRYVIYFPDDFNNKIENELLISLLCDKRGNCGENIPNKFLPVWAETCDIVISEIMADPSPQVSLPPKEYLEIINRSSFPVNLWKWSLAFNDEKVILPPEIIMPGEYQILCYLSDTASFSRYGKVIGLKPFPALSDDGKMLCLSDSLGNFIHGVEYSSAWYGNALKKGGGWSLEIIDTGYPFFTKGNWEASNSVTGGTPGKVNSGARTNEDLIFEGIVNAFPEDSGKIVVKFSETITDLAALSGKIYLDNTRIDSIAPGDMLLRQYSVKPGMTLKAGEVYSLILPGELTDFAGNQIITSSFGLGLPDTGQKGEIVFNELLFNPLPGDPDYIELYNCSEKVLDVSTLFLASVGENGDTSALVPVSGEKRCLLPASYYTITTESVRVTDRYSSNAGKNIFEVAQLPSMPDDRGHLLLLNNRAEVLDEVIYSQTMHHPLLSGNEGIALEKLRPEMSSSDPASWHSASESSGWGTPGAANSVNVPWPVRDDLVNFSSGRISPDNDGFEDQLIIDFRLEGTGNVITATIFDETGTFIRKIAENYLAGPEATLVWDGTGADRTLVEQGIYIILIQLYDETGKTRTWKKVCTVIR